jgi:hypothetical protein
LNENSKETLTGTSTYWRRGVSQSQEREGRILKNMRSIRRNWRAIPVVRNVVLETNRYV